VDITSRHREGDTVYIGIGTVILVLAIIAVIMLLRGRTTV
jgi:hypothetical protein